MQMPNALAAARLRPLSDEAQLSMVGHLDELRARLLVSLAALAVAFGICFWQNHELLRLVNKPLAHQTQGQVRAGHGPLGATYRSSATRGTSPDSSAPWPEWSNHSRPATPRRWPRFSATFSATSTSCRRRPRVTAR